MDPALRSGGQRRTLATKLRGHYTSSAMHGCPLALVSPDFGETGRGCSLPSARKQQFESLSAFFFRPPVLSSSIFVILRKRSRSLASDSQRRIYAFVLGTVRPSVATSL